MIQETKPRVLLLIKCLGYGGAERLLVDIAANRDRDRFDYEAAYVLRGENALVPAMEATGVPVHCLGAGGNWDPRWMMRFRHLLVHGRFDIVHAHLPQAAALGRLVVATLPRSRRPLLVYTEHSMWDKMALLVKAVNRLTIGMDRVVVTVSESARRALPESLGRQARVVVHGVDLDRSDHVRSERDLLRRKLRAEFEIPDEALAIVTVANLRPEKGYDVLLEATRRLGPGAPVRVVAVGRGPLREELESRARALGLEGRFFFAGQRSDALELMGGGDLFVLASRQEGLPVALMEACSLGLPVVATRVGEMARLLIDGRNAMVVPPENPDALAAALEQVIADPQLRERLGRGSLELAGLFDVATAAKEIETIYGEILEARK